jgi:hypothetical protein
MEAIYGENTRPCTKTVAGQPLGTAPSAREPIPCLRGQPPVSGKGDESLRFTVQAALRQAPILSPNRTAGETRPIPQREVLKQPHLLILLGAGQRFETVL